MPVSGRSCSAEREKGWMALWEEGAALERDEGERRRGTLESGGDVGIV